MSLKQFVARKNGFKEGLRVGEVIEFENKKYVVIRILHTKISTFGNPYIKANFIGQEIGKHTDYSKYEDYFTFSKRYNLAKGERNLYRMGEVFTDDKEKERPLISIIGIETLEYEFTDLIVTYQVELIKPWTKFEINVAVKKNRISTFRVISSS